MSQKIVEKLRKRVIKNFMDILVLTKLRNSQMSGYDVISYIHKRFGILVSSGTVYSLLYSLERQGLIKGAINGRKRVYLLTEKSEQDLESIKKTGGEIQNLLRNILSLNEIQQSPTPTRKSHG